MRYRRTSSKALENTPALFAAADRDCLTLLVVVARQRRVNLVFGLLATGLVNAVTALLIALSPCGGALACPRFATLAFSASALEPCCSYGWQRHARL